MAYQINPNNVAALLQGNTTFSAWMDVVAPTGQLSTLRMISGDTQRWEFRNGAVAAGTWDLYNVPSSGSGGSVLISTGIGNLQIPSLGTPPGGSVDLVVDSNGNIYKQSSSLRDKENVKPLVEDFQKVMTLTPVSFVYKGGTGEQIGYTAEAVEAAGLTHLVSHDEEGRPEGVSYKHLGIYAIELLKQQQQVIEELRSAVSALEAKVAA